MCEIELKILFKDSQEEGSDLVIGVELCKEPKFQARAMKSFIFFLQKALNSSMHISEIIYVT